MRFLHLALAGAFSALTIVGADAASPPAAEPARPGVRPAEAGPQPAADPRGTLYARLAAADADETDGLVGLLMASYARTGSDTGDLLLERGRKAIAAQDHAAAARIYDAAIAFMPARAEAWNARATLRYLDDDAEGAMADIAETLKRDPRHLGALMGMTSLLEARERKTDALAVCQRALAIAPHWRLAEERADRLKAAIAGRSL